MSRRKSIKLGKGLRINLGKKGVASISTGSRKSPLKTNTKKGKTTINIFGFKF